MGVPGFFLWLSKKYKNNNLIIKKNKLSSNTDYLLIDANSLIHPICMKVVNNHFTNNTTELENNMLSKQQTRNNN